MFTQAFGKIKGQAELQLLALQEDLPSLNVYSPRPSFVDTTGHVEIREALVTRKGPAIEKFLPFIGPIFRLFPNHVSPTPELGKVLVDLALSDGGELSGDGVEKGRIFEPWFLRTLYRNGVAASKS